MHIRPTTNKNQCQTLAYNVAACRSYRCFLSQHRGRHSQPSSFHSGGFDGEAGSPYSAVTTGTPDASFLPQALLPSCQNTVCLIW
ncbi:hypothetical protein FC093_20190 [Ilyomonas limi]|uniref:Uncharacterized protein n=1 Tax=Ilyomonas limi TaxID=2575867 RepID=A0A4V5UTL0_9BACT|nr:hypothetical protein [Ilyomonas limi]TKK65433.1 hypothetical protein FC093_20190 [Ilyomonas limi]